MTKINKSNKIDFLAIMAAEEKLNELKRINSLNKIASSLKLDHEQSPKKDDDNNGQIPDEINNKCRTENDKNSEVGSYFSHSSKSMASSAATRGATKIYYHIDDEQTPYCTEVPTPPDKITLGDFKRVLNRTNFKFYCKAIDPEVGGEVKAEIRDDGQPLSRSSNGHFELFLLTAEGSTSQSDGTSSVGFSKIAALKRTIPGPAPLYPLTSTQLYRPRQHFQQQQHFDSNFGPGHRRRPFEDSTIYTTETDGRIYSDDESHLSTSTDNITSVSRQHYNLYRRRRRPFPRNRRQPSRASSLSSMTETSMALEVITVTLNMDTVNFLGISIVGQSSARGDNGIYVASVMPGGAVALDGRIEPGDMILQVNDISFEDFKNDHAAEVLKQAVHKKGPIKLTVAKSFDVGRANYFSVPPREPVRPIDTHAWVQHTNAVRGVATGGGGGGTLVSAMNAIPEGSEGAPTPIPGQHPHQQTNHQGPPSAMMNAFMQQMGAPQQQQSQLQPQQHQQRPASSSTTATSNGSGGGGAGPQTIIGPGGVLLAMQPRLDLHSDKRKVVQTMAMPNSGLDIRDRTWLKIPIPMSFLGSSLVDWLIENIDGLKERKEARRYAADLLKEHLIAHVVNKQQFTEQCYYIFGDECAALLQQRQSGVGSENGGGVSGTQFQQIEMTTLYNQHNRTTLIPSSYIQQTNIGSSDYASMPPVSPYPNHANIQMPTEYHNHQIQQQQTRQPQKFNHPVYGVNMNPIQRVVAGIPEQQLGTTSQTSNNSNEESSGSEQRRKVILPPAPSLTSVGPQQQQQFRPHYAGQNLTGAVAPRPPPIGAPPSTPIGDEAAGNAAVVGKYTGLQNLQQMNVQHGRIRLAENFPELFVEHF